MRMKKLLWVLLATLGMNGVQAEELVVYSARNEQLIKPLFDAYTKETGVVIKFITDKEGPLLARLRAEGSNSPADILMTVVAGILWQAANEGVLKAIDSPTLQANVPAHLRDAQNRWFGLSVRARTIFFNPKKVKASELSSYEALADGKWKGRLCLRSSKKVYNQSLVSMLIAEHGEPKTEKILKSWVANLATEPFADDTKLLEAIGAGQCDVGVANTYYYGRLMEKQPHLSVSLFWPNQQTHAGGVHVNVSGAGVTKYSKHEKSAVKLLEWLSSEKAQNLYADVNLEYPANPKVKWDKTVEAWGKFRASPLNVAKAGEYQAAATKLMDRVGYK